jgi:probable blue pigment (indigoidine) exporter
MRPSQHARMSFKNIALGICFAMLWASASVASKFGLRSVEPLVLFNIRLFLAGVLLLTFVFIRAKKIILPSQSELKSLLVFAFLNTTFYLTCFVVSMQTVAAGIGSLSTAMGPLIISIISALWLKRKIRNLEIIALLLGIIGVGFATFPLLKTSYFSWFGISILGIGIVSVSTASVYYSQLKSSLDRIAFNGWQVFLGSLMMLPMTLLTSTVSKNHFDQTFFYATLWLVVPVSIVSMILWFTLLSKDPVRASMWLFLCPIFGFTYAYFLLKEPISIFTLIGTVLVVIGLYFGQKEKLRR